MYVNGLIRMLKSKCEPDGFLGWLHSLMLMDDTVIMATSRERMEEKLGILNEFCDQSGMVINNDKTKFMVINGDNNDRKEIHFGNVAVHNCERYVYLGSCFTQDGKIVSALKEHAKAKSCHVLKFKAFVSRNVDVPFWVKKMVLDSALLSAILYGCEGWLISNMDCMNSLYISGVKALLGVRRSTPNDLCLAESGYPPLLGYIKEIQFKFFTNMFQHRSNLNDDPFIYVWDLVNTARTPCAQYVNHLLAGDNFVTSEQAKLKQRIQNSVRTKPSTYLTHCNADLETHEVYTSKLNVPEHYRIAFSRIRLGSHNLMIERGRWSRIPRQERKCVCGSVQTEEHVLCFCPVADSIRHSLPPQIFHLPELFQYNPKVVCKLCYDILNLY
jgi:hypothetical protein